MRSDIKKHQTPLEENYDFGVDHGLMKAFGLDGSNENLTPNFKEIAKHLVFSDNLSHLQNAVNSVGSSVTSKKANEEESEETSEETPVLDKEEIKDNLGDSADLSDEAAKLLGSKDSREFIDLLSRDEDLYEADRVVIKDLLGYGGPFKRKTKDIFLKNHLEKRHDPNSGNLHRVPKEENLEEIRDESDIKVAEGQNRALNILLKEKASNKNLIGYSLEDLMTEMGNMFSQQDKALFKKALYEYRRAGNYPNVEEEGAPESIRKEVNKSYLWVGVPHHEDINLDSQGISDAKSLGNSIRNFVLEENPSKSMDIAIVDAPWLRDASPVKGATTAVVLSINGKKLFDGSGLTTTLEEPDQDKDSEVKTASEEGTARTFLQEFSPGGLSFKSFTRKKWEDLFSKWFTLNAFLSSNGSVSSFVKPSAHILSIIEKAKKDIDLFSTKGKSDFLNELLSNNPRSEVIKEVISFYIPKARVYAEDLDDLFESKLETKGRGALEDIYRMLSKSIYTLLVNSIQLNPPKNINEWIVGAASAKDKGLSSSQLITYLDKLLQSVSKHKWENVLNPNDNFLQEVLLEWVHFLEKTNSIGLANSIGGTIPEIKEVAEDITENIVAVSVSQNEAPRIIKARVKNYLMDRSGKSLDSFVAPSLDSDRVDHLVREEGRPYQYLIFVSPDWFQKGSGFSKTVPLTVGKKYTLQTGPYSDLAYIRKRQEKNESGKAQRNPKPKQFDGYVLKVKDGFEKLPVESLRLTDGEIPRFLEFATKFFLKELNEKETPASQLGDEDAESIVDNLSEDLHNEELGAGYDSIYERNLSKVLGGKEVKDIEGYLKKLNKQKEGVLALNMKNYLGSHAFVDKDGNVVHKKSTIEKYRDDIEGDVSSILRERRSKIIRKLSRNSADVDIPTLSSAKTQKEILDILKNSKQVKEEFLKRVLSNDDLPVNNNLYWKTLESYFIGAVESVMKSLGMKDFLKEVENAEVQSSRYSASPILNSFTKTLENTNKHYKTSLSRIREPYLDLWEKARSKDSILFDKVFTLEKSTTNLMSSALQTKDQIEYFLSLVLGEPEEIEYFLGLVLSESEEILKGKFKEEIEKTLYPNNGTWRETRSKEEVTVPRLKELARSIFDAYPSEVAKILSEKGVQDDFFDKKVKAPKDSLKFYRVKADADPSDIFTFLDNNDKLKEILMSKSDNAHTFKKMKGGIRGYSVSAPKTKEDSEKKKEKKRNAWTNQVKKALHGTLNAFQEEISENYDTQKTLTEGKGLKKALFGARSYQDETNNIPRLNEELKNLFAEARDIRSRAKNRALKQIAHDEELGEESKSYPDYDSPKYLYKKKVDVLTKWFKDLTPNQGHRVLNYLNNLLKNPGSSGVSELDDAQNIKVLKKIAKLYPGRNIKTYKSVGR